MFCLQLSILQPPIPASRPRFSRWGGVHYGKRYTQYRKDAPLAVANAIKEAKAEDSLPIKDFIIIAVIFEVKKPKTTKNKYPHPDLDNYIKALYDSLQANGVIIDDKQIIASLETKKWTSQTPQTTVLIQTVPSSSMSLAPHVTLATHWLDTQTIMDTASVVDTTNNKQEKK